MKFYVVIYPNKKDRVFTNLKDAKNCLSNFWDIHRGKIEEWVGNRGKTVYWSVKNWEKAYIAI